MDISSIISLLSKLFTNTNSNTQPSYQAPPQQQEANKVVNASSYPQPFNTTKQEQNLTNMPIYPQSEQVVVKQEINQSPINNITSILSNPEAINLIKQIIPLLTSSNNGNLLSNLFTSGSKKNVPENSVAQANSDEFDIDSYIKIDDC